MDAAKAQLDLRRPLQSGGRPWRPPHDVYVAAALVSRARVDSAFTRRAVIHAALHSRIQFDVLEAVATVVLNEPDYELFSALMKYGESIEKERNALAHGSFGGSPEIADGVAWIDPRHLTEHTVRASAAGVTDEAMALVRSKTFVYELGDLETIAREIENLHDQLIFFIGYLVSRYLEPPMTEEWRAQRYRELCAEPRVAQALASLRKNRK